MQRIRVGLLAYIWPDSTSMCYKAYYYHRWNRSNWMRTKLLVIYSLTHAAAAAAATVLALDLDMQKQLYEGQQKCPQLAGCATYL